MIVQHVPPVDRLRTHGADLLLYERRLVRLSDLGSAIVDLTAEPTDTDELAADLQRRFGAPESGDPAAATRTAAEALVADGVLRVLPD